MNPKSSTLALTAASSLLVVPLQVQAVAEFEASASFEMSFSLTDQSDGILLFGSETGASTGPLVESVSGDAQVGPDTQSSNSSQENGSISFAVGVQGNAGANVLNGSASQSLQAQAFTFIVCSAEVGVCEFDISSNVSVLESSSVTLPAFESAAAEAGVTVEYGTTAGTLATLCASGTGLEDGGFQTCTLQDEQSIYFTASGFAEGSADARYPAEVSEPAVLALFGVGTLGLAALRRRRPRAG